MSYAIFRVEPINKLSDLAQIGSHNKREKKAYKSNPDIDITKRVKDVGKLIGIRLVDHIIIGDNEYSSLMEMGLM